MHHLISGFDDPSRNHLSWKSTVGVAKSTWQRLTAAPERAESRQWVAARTCCWRQLRQQRSMEMWSPLVSDWRLKVYIKPQRYHNFTRNCNAVVYNLRACNKLFIPLAVIWSVWVCWMSRRNSLLLPVTTVHTTHKTFWYFTEEITQTEQTSVVWQILNVLFGWVALILVYFVSLMWSNNASARTAARRVSDDWLWIPKNGTFAKEKLSFSYCVRLKWQFKGIPARHASGFVPRADTVLNEVLLLSFKRVNLLV